MLLENPVLINEGSVQSVVNLPWCQALVRDPGIVLMPYRHFKGPYYCGITKVDAKTMASECRNDISVKKVLYLPLYCDPEKDVRPTYLYARSEANFGELIRCNGKCTSRFTPASSHEELKQAIIGLADSLALTDSLTEGSSDVVVPCMLLGRIMCLNHVKIDDIFGEGEVKGYWLSLIVNNILKGVYI